MSTHTEEILKRAGTVSGHCQLDNVRVRTLDAVLHLPEPDPPYKAATEVSATIDQAEQEFVVQLDYKVASKTVEGEQALFDISVGLLLEYSLDDGANLGSEDFEAFALLSSTFSAHPYLREIVANSTMRMGLPPLMLQVLRSPLSFLPEVDPPKNDSSAISPPKAAKTAKRRRRQESEVAGGSEAGGSAHPPRD